VLACVVRVEETLSGAGHGKDYGWPYQDAIGH